MNIKDAVNEVLLSLNELPLDDTDNISDIGIAVTANEHIEIARKRILSKGWYFNTITTDLVPDVDGYIIIPNSYLSVDSVANNNIIVRDAKLFDKDEFTFIFDEAEECTIVEDVVLDDLPFTITDYIVQLASLNAYISIIGNSDDVAIRRENVNLARIEAMKDNARIKDGNIFDHTDTSTLLDRTSR